MDETSSENRIPELSFPSQSPSPSEPAVSSGSGAGASPAPIAFQPPKGYSWRGWLLIFFLALTIIGAGFAGTTYFLNQPSQANQEGVKVKLAKASNKADEQRKNDLKLIAGALNSFYQKYQMYPSFKKEGYEWCDATRLGQDLVPEYLEEIPSDPTGKPYFIYLIPDGGYVVAAKLEDGNDPDATKEKTIPYEMGEISGGTYTEIKFNTDSCPAGASFNFWLTSQ